MVIPELLPTPDSMPSGTLAADSTAVVSLRRGIRYHVIWLKIGDSGAASNGLTLTSVTDLATYFGRILGEIRIKLGTKVVRTMTAAELNSENLRNGSAYACKFSGTAGNANHRLYLPIFLAEPWRNNNREVSTSAWNVVGVDSFQIEVVFKSGIISPTLSGWFEWDNLVQNNIGLIQKWERKSLGALGTTQTFQNFDRKGFLQSVTFYPTVEGTPKYVNALRVKVNGQQVRDLLNVTENQALLLGRGMAPDTAAVPRFEWVADYTDPVTDWLNLNGAESFECYVEYNAAAAGTMIALIQSVQEL